MGNKIWSIILPSQLFRNNGDGKTSLKLQKSPETTTDTQDVSAGFYIFHRHIENETVTM